MGQSNLPQGEGEIRATPPFSSRTRHTLRLPKEGARNTEDNVEGLQGAGAPAALCCARRGQARMAEAGRGQARLAEAALPNPTEGTASGQPRDESD